ncbi:hypothetical protein PRJBM_00098 [Bartonella henselae]|uniref:hypothetical protein n=1 Tax=Bartonella henselae TaxID=38323 RepID=UPI0003DF99F0|nr:hypothetical protein [Bartonella henselae]ETS09235.1 hypothetical protein Q654_00632 [Bartonella henselae JK 50]ETS09392.1 hypothetical protein Q655_00580 [Bartonella henselae JK 51]ETS09719.1 hypothetical protein Q653_00793 [Bartonella henselae JK 42]ETS12747.1 hypothetical protein Q652_00923 [Bartonella henselae JK 41]KEC58502.1 hypothetical protein O97_00400 [Bartonella henselae str. Zeus]KEC61111.1 hypothetical protein O95_00062 [Bartonella henselae JK 53]PNM39277.1 hypothetical prote
MSVPNAVKCSHFKLLHSESGKNIRLHVTKETGIWKKTFKKEIQMPFMNRLSARVITYEELAKRMIVLACDDYLSRCIVYEFTRFIEFCRYESKKAG